MPQVFAPQTDFFPGAEPFETSLCNMFPPYRGGEGGCGPTAVKGRSRDRETGTTLCFLYLEPFRLQDSLTGTLSSVKNYIHSVHRDARSPEGLALVGLFDAVGLFVFFSSSVSVCCCTAFFTSEIFPSQILLPQDRAGLDARKCNK